MSEALVQPEQDLKVTFYTDGYPNQALLKKRLPFWYARSSPEMHIALYTSQLKSHAAQCELNALIEPPRSIYDVARRLLNQQLLEQFAIAIDCRHIYLQRMTASVGANIPNELSLLEAALQNFPVDQDWVLLFKETAYLPALGGAETILLQDVCDDGPVDCASGLFDITAVAIAGLYRSLDLGGKYQAHLDTVFKPVTPPGQPAGTRQRQVAAAFILREHRRLEVLAHIARMKNDVSQDAYLALLEVAKTDGKPVWRGGSVRYNALRLFGDGAGKGDLLHGALMITPATQPGGPIVVYLPGEPEHPLKEYESTSAFIDVLRRKLDSATYRQYFVQFVRLALRPAFLRKVTDALRPMGRDGVFDANAVLPLEGQTIAGSPLQTLYEQALSQTYADARVMAVPVTGKPGATQYPDLGLFRSVAHALFDIADVFLPASEVRHLLKESFLGIESWLDGDTEEALEHLFELGKSVALMNLPVTEVKRVEALQRIYEDGKNAAELVRAALASARGKREDHEENDPDADDDEAAVEVLVEISQLEHDGSEWVAKTTAPSEFIEGLVQITSANGEVRLWKPTLAPLAQRPALPAGAVFDARSLFRKAGRTWLSMQGRYYEIAFDAAVKKWRVKTPDGNRRYSPILESNGAGAWRHAGENPMGWGAYTAFRRLHGDFAGIPKPIFQRILRVTAVDEALLRQVHVDRLVPPALLLDCIQRFRIDHEVSGFIQCMIDGAAGEFSGSFVVANIEPYLNFLVTLPGWPDGLSVHLLDSKGRLVSTHGPSADAARRVEVSYVPGHMKALLEALLAQLSALETELLLVNYSGASSQSEYLAQRFAYEAKGRRPLLFELIYASRNNTTEPIINLIKRDFPSLPDSVADEVTASASQAEMTRMRSTSRIPLRLAEQAREYLQQLRLNRALECFYLPELDNTDNTRLALSLVDSLPGWPASLAFDVRGESFDGPQVLRVGNRQAAASDVHRVLVRSVFGYQVFDSHGLCLDPGYRNVYQALLDCLPELDRRQMQLTDRASLGIALGDLATSQRGSVKKLLGLHSIKPGVKWPSRLADGRIGYPLSGRMRGLFRKLKGSAATFSPELAVQTLYPQFTAAEVTGFTEKLVTEHTGGVQQRKALMRARLNELAEQYRVLDSTLNEWVAEVVLAQRAELPGATVDGRKLARSRILSCWRREHESVIDPAAADIRHQLDLSSLSLGALPAINANFDHVSALLLDNLGLTTDDVQGFIGQFAKLRRLTLRSNLLSAVPVAVGNLSDLESLVLSHNPITLDPPGMARLQRLALMQVLELEGHDAVISAPVDLRHWSELVELKLRGVGLTAMPAGIGEFETLRHADLRHNQITDIAEDALRQIASRPDLYVQLHHNPLTAETISRAENVFSHALLGRMGLVELFQHQELPSTPSKWLSGGEDQAQRQKWLDLQNEPQAADFFQLLNDLPQSADYRNNRHALTQRVWRMIDAATASTQLRQTLFERAGHPQTCGDGVMLVFNEMDIQVLIFNLESSSDDVRAVDRFRLMRGLERLDELERIALEDFSARAAGRPSLDQAEVRMVYPTQLKYALKLPGQAQDMLFENLAGVTPQQLEDARARVIARENTAGFFQSIVARESWMAFLQKEYAQRFEAVAEPFHERLLALSGSNDDAYVQGAAQVQQEYKAATDALAMQLTREIAQGEARVG